MIIDAGHTTSYSLNSVVAEPNLTKFLHNVQKSLLINRYNRSCDIPVRIRTPVCRMLDNRQIATESQQKFHKLFLNFVVARSMMFTKFLHNVAESSLYDILKPLNDWQICFRTPEQSQF